MKELNINSLLEKYWKAETSLKEEEEIKSYFQYGQVAPEHEAFQPMFGFFSEEKTKQYSKALSFGSEAQIKPMIDWKKRFLSMAAVLLILISASWFFNLETKKDMPTYEFASVEDPDEAFDVTMKALALVGKKLNHSSNQIHQNIRYTDKMNIIKPNQ